MVKNNNVNNNTALAIFFVAFAVVFIVGLIVIPVIEAAEATTGAGGGGGEGIPPITTTTPASASAAAAPSSSRYSKLDFTDPSLNVPNDMVLQTGFGGNILLYSVTAQDNVDGTATLDENNKLIQDNVGGSITIQCNPPSQSLLPVGNRKAICFTQDSSYNYNSEYFIVTVRDPTSPAPTDTIAPNLAVPNGLVITTDKPTQPSASFEVAATDNVDGTATLDRNGYIRQDDVGGTIEMACNPNSYSKFPVGDNTVTCRAVDAVGNRGTASFTLSVVSTAPEDTIPPVIQEPNILPSRSPAGATTYTVVATDNVDGTATLGEYDKYPTQDNVGGGMYLECYPSSGSVFSAGDNLQCAAYDSSGNVVETTFTVPTAGVPQAAALNATTLNATTPLVDATTPSPLVNATTPLAVEEEEEAPPITTITPEEEEEEEAPPPPPPTTTEEEEDTTTDEEGGAGDTGGGGDDTEDGGGDEPPATTTEEGGGEEGADEGAE